ncbi:adenylate/guanylate cyclase domain-containing protein [Polynucleobacter necessarius]|uniref:adenylate/guanylate cyclase domain-containing protein n=1 Tax=Polynucleobacter necessarius TaxID=576610 RepID=UPI0013B065B7|nr:adenylate/guanylate cyclase domain-containing protein [Polynucleobacter necessarius]
MARPINLLAISVMAFWGAPALNPHHACHSAVAAIKTKRRMVKLNQELIQEGKPLLVVRIGINTDAVLAGNIGSEERLSYTVYGEMASILHLAWKVSIRNLA